MHSRPNPFWRQQCGDGLLRIFYWLPLMMLLWLMARPAVAKIIEPLVIVVHGIGGGNREDGWSDEIANKWGLFNVHEVTFRSPGRDDGQISMVDFASKGGEWAKSVQAQIAEIIRLNPGRPIVLVAHSWGSVATSLALNGGQAGSVEIDPIQLGDRKISELVTLGSPQGGKLLKEVGVQLNDGRPRMVSHWSNFYDVEDPVSEPSKNLTGAENIEVRDSAQGWLPASGNLDLTKYIGRGMQSHTGIWTNPSVTAFIKKKRDEFRRQSGNAAKNPLPPAAQEPIDAKITGSLQAESGDKVIYKAAVSGGTGSYEFVWLVDGKQTFVDGDALSATWAGTGDHVVKVVIFDKKTKVRCERSVTVTVAARPLSVKLEGPQQGRVGETSRYSVSIKGGVGSHALQWILDGAPQNVKDAAVTTTWAVPGNHVMEVVVTDDQKNTSSDRVTTDVAGINFDAKPPSGPGTASVGEQSIYRLTATGGTPPYTYRWMLNGNEVNLNDPAIALTWQNPGPWALAVTVSDSQGASRSFNQTVNVNPSGGNVNPPTSSPSPPSNTGGVRSAGSFAGEWSYSWVTSKGNGASARLHLTVSGSSLVGTYTYGDPPSTIQATLSSDGRTFEGNFREPHDVGTMRCSLSPDGNSFVGSWDSSGPGGSGSTGTCSGSRSR